MTFGLSTGGDAESTTIASLHSIICDWLGRISEKACGGIPIAPFAIKEFIVGDLGVEFGSCM